MKIGKPFLNLSIALISILSTIIVLELILRIFPNLDLEVNNPYKYTKTLGRRKPDIPLYSYSQVYPLCFDRRRYYKKSDGVIYYHFNQFGARWIKAREQKLGDKNVIVVGDSFTFGFGLRYEDTYIFKSQDLLRQDGISLNFLNFSKLGATSETFLDIYKKWRKKIDHDILLYGLHMNDLIAFPTSYVAVCYPKSSFWIENKSKPMQIIRKYGTWPINKSRLMNFIMKRIIQKKGREEKIQEIISPSKFEKPRFINNMNAIREMSLEANQNGAKFIVVILPILVDVQKTTFKPVYDRIKSSFETYGIEYIDLTSSVNSYSDKELWILPFDQHPNEIANEIFARNLSISLKEAIK